MTDAFPLAVLGAGAWGSAIAAVAARKQRRVILWSRKGLLPPALSEFHSYITATGNLDDIQPCRVAALVTPAQTTREMTQKLQSCLAPDAPLIICAKGIERETGSLLSDIARDYLPNPLAVLSGPSFAAEVLNNLPTALTLALSDTNSADKILSCLAAPHFRLYSSDDMTGVQIGGALKNVIAIAAGLVMGAGLGENARAALVTRGLAEMARLGQKMGAKPLTFMGLSGLGDLSLTCHSAQSRNYSYGFALGSNSETASATIEGIATCDAVLKLAAAHDIEMPVARAVQAVIKGTSLVSVMEELLNRPFKSE